jgi:hypothetical protein
MEWYLFKHKVNVTLKGIWTVDWLLAKEVAVCKSCEIKQQKRGHLRFKTENFTEKRF